MESGFLFTWSCFWKPRSLPDVERRGCARCAETEGKGKGKGEERASRTLTTEPALKEEIKELFAAGDAFLREVGLCGMFCKLLGYLLTRTTFANARWNDARGWEGCI